MMADSNGARDDQRAVVQARGVTLELHPAVEPLWLDGDAARIVQTVANLIHNAAKFTPRGGRIEVSLTREQGHAVLRVRDTGAGISAHDLPRLFEPFVQLRTTLSRGDGGLGLGLALVKGIVELHGGSVSAASADSLADVLLTMGHDVRVAYDGLGGVAAASEFHPDVVLCDIGLPDLDGYEVARRLRANGALLVALSGYGQPEDRQRSAQAGFAWHVVKPVTVEVLQRVLA